MAPTYLYLDCLQEVESLEVILLGNDRAMLVSREPINFSWIPCIYFVLCLNMACVLSDVNGQEKLHRTIWYVFPIVVNYD